MGVTNCLRRGTAVRPITTMILYKPGSQFLFKGRVVSVDFVIIRRTGMWIRLVEREEACRPEDLTPLGTQNSRQAQGGVRG
jgi:hypothetical protein